MLENTQISINSEYTISYVDSKSKRSCKKLGIFTGLFLTTTFSFAAFYAAKQLRELDKDISDNCSDNLYHRCQELVFNHNMLETATLAFLISAIVTITSTVFFGCLSKNRPCIKFVLKHTFLNFSHIFLL